MKKNDGYDVIRVTFDNPTSFGRSSQRYSFKTVLENLQVDDKVIVECATGLQVCTVREVKEANEYRSEATKWAFQKVDQGRLAFLNGREKTRKEILAALDKKLKERSEQDRYRELARVDPEAEQLLMKLEELEAYA